jgi:signal transduction histidine kinase/DNA-binding response OmpR family regulator
MTTTRTKILLIEDNPADARLVRELLMEVGASLYDLVDVGLFSDGLRHLKDNGCDIVLLDLSLPDGTGIDMVTRLQSAVPQTPIVVLTGLDDDQIALDAMRAGVQDFLIKGSFDGPMLARALRYAIERKRAQPALAGFEDQAALNSIVMTVSQSLQLDKLLEIIIAKVLEVTGCEIGHIRLRHRASGELILAAHQGLSPEHVDALLQPHRPAEKLAQVLKTGEIVVARSSRPLALSGRMEKGIDRLLVWIPLKAKGEVIGVLFAATARRKNFSKRDLDLLTAIGNVIGVGVENARLYTETRRQLERIEALRDIGVATASSLDLSRVLKILLGKITVMLPYSAVSIRLLDEASGELRATASWNLDDRDWKASNGKGGLGLASAVFEKKRPLAIRDFLSDPRTTRPEMFRRQGLVSYLGLPMIANGEGVGVLSIYIKFEHEFSADEIGFFAALANQAAMAIYNSQIHGAMSQLARDLERSNHAKEEFLGVISHELRTPLNVVKGYVEMLQSGFFGAMNREQGKAVEKISNQTRVQLGMINSILSATTMESEVAVVQTGVVSLADFLGDFRVAFPDLADGSLRFEWLYSLSLPDIRIDRTKLQYILQNLVNNAVKFTPAGVVTVSLDLSVAPDGSSEPARTHQRKNWLTLRVADTGVGIAEEFLPVIFEKFSQVDSSTGRSHEGIGLGLHIVKRCTELLNGTLKVDSEVGKGTTFTIKIPCEIENEQILPASGVEEARA